MPAAASRSVYLIETYCTPRMPFCLSSGDTGLVNLPLALLDEDEHLTRDVAFEAADRLHLRMALADALGYVCLSSSIGPQPADGDNVQRAIGSSVAAPGSADGEPFFPTRRARG